MVKYQAAKDFDTLSLGGWGKKDTYKPLPQKSLKNTITSKTEVIGRLY